MYNIYNIQYVLTLILLVACNEWEKARLHKANAQVKEERGRGQKCQKCPHRYCLVSKNDWLSSVLLRTENPPATKERQLKKDLLQHSSCTVTTYNSCWSCPRPRSITTARLIPRPTDGWWMCLNHDEIEMSRSENQNKKTIIVFFPWWSSAKWNHISNSLFKLCGPIISMR